MWRRVWCVAMLWACGCGTASYRPLSNQPQTISAGQVRVVQAIKRDPTEDEITLVTQLEPGTKLLRAGLTGQDDGCPDPLASLQTIDGVPRSSFEPPLLDGQHTLMLNISALPNRSLSLETERLGVRVCDEVELAWPQAWEREPFWLADFRLSFLALEPGISVGGLRFLAARWSGRLRLGAEVGLANSVVCDGDCPGRFALPLGVEAAASWRATSGFYFVLGGRPLMVWAQDAPSGPLALRALALQATGELMLGGSARDEDQAPSTAVLGLGVSAGPSLALGASQTKPGVALGFQLNYGLIP